LAKNDQRKIIKGKKPGAFNELALRIKLIWRLLLDRRIHPLLKLLPFGTLLYFLFPDFLPGPVDDALIIWLGAYLFVELCPDEIVQEHMDALTKVIEGEWHEIEE
jgi:hypothetical protein